MPNKPSIGCGLYELHAVSYFVILGPHITAQLFTTT